LYIIVILAISSLLRHNPHFPVQQKKNPYLQATSEIEWSCLQGLTELIL
jgi:hypothetical protein